MPVMNDDREEQAHCSFGDYDPCMCGCGACVCDGCVDAAREEVSRLREAIQDSVATTYEAIIKIADDRDSAWRVADAHAMVAQAMKENLDVMTKRAEDVEAERDEAITRAANLADWDRKRTLAIREQEERAERAEAERNEGVRLLREFLDVGCGGVCLKCDCHGTHADHCDVRAFLDRVAPKEGT